MMRTQVRTGQLELAAGVLTWAVVSGLACYIIVRGGDRYTGLLLPAVVIMVVNLLAMLYACRQETTISAGTRLAHATQVASALSLGWLLPISFLPIYTIIWIAMAIRFYSFRTCWWLMAAVMLTWFLLMRFGWSDDDAIFNVALFATFHLFAMLSARAAREAEATRDQLAMLNRELIATQHLLSEAARQSERTRIARDLHDLLGHHLTALSINLQIAERLVDGEAKPKIAESRALARLLLSDVREAVSTLREESAVDFTRAISLVTENAPQIDIELDIEDGLAIDDVEVAESLLRCVQESITNTLKHAGARRCWIRVWQAQGRLNLEVRDDGRTSGDIVEGNGLAGMRERLARIHGSLRLDTQGNALRLHVEIPIAG